jgi:hypothetical protein
VYKLPWPAPTTRLLILIQNTPFKVDKNRYVKQTGSFLSAEENRMMLDRIQRTWKTQRTGARFIVVRKVENNPWGNPGLHM